MSRPQSPRGQASKGQQPVPAWKLDWGQGQEKRPSKALLSVRPAAERSRSEDVSREQTTRLAGPESIGPSEISPTLQNLRLLRTTVRPPSSPPLTLTLVSGGQTVLAWLAPNEDSTLRLFGGPLITHCSIASAPLSPGPQASDVGHRTTSLPQAKSASKRSHATDASQRRQREHSQANPPSVASKWPTKMRESRPQIPACWPRIPHAGKHEMPLKGPSFQPIPSLQPADRRSTPRSLATDLPLPLPLPSGSETSSLVSHDAQLQTDRFASVRPDSRPSCPVLSILSPQGACSEPRTPAQLPLLTVQFPPYHIWTLSFGTHGSRLNFKFCDYSAVASASISNPSPPLAITRCCAMLFFACSRTG